MTKRKKYKANDKMLTSKAMAAMRDAAFGARAYFATKDILHRAECLRDDDAMIAAAEQKRLRKQAKRKA